MNRVATTYTHIDIDKHSSIEEQRNKVLNDTEFQQWCKQYNIGSRVEVRSEAMNRATDMMNQYNDYYPKWVQRMYQ